MEVKIQTIPLVVRDKAKALEFYTEKIGFDKKTDATNNGYRYVTVGPKGQDLELLLWEVGSFDAGGQSKNWKPASAPPVLMKVEDCRAMFAELKSKGVVFTQEPEENPWSTSATFSDPDGNLFSIHQFRQWSA